jgi:hypothetical protein
MTRMRGNKLHPYHGVDALIITFCLCLRLPTRPRVEGIENRNTGRLEIRNVSRDHGEAIFKRRASNRNPRS